MIAICGAPGIAGLARPALATALEQNLVELWSHFGRAPGSRLHDERGAVWFDTCLDRLPYNGVLRFAVDRDVDARVDALVGHYRRRGVPFIWVVAPDSRPLDLAARLARRGLRQIELLQGMAVALADLPAPPASLPAPYEIRAVSGEREAAILFQQIARRWHVPPAAQPYLWAVNESVGIGLPAARVRAWLAWRGREPVAKAVLFQDGVDAGLYGVATRSDARRLGLGRALTLTAFQAARQSGAVLGLLHATPMAVSLYTRLGLTAVAPFRVYASQPLPP